MPVESLSHIFALTQTASMRAVGLCYDEVAFNTKMLQDFEPHRKNRALLKVMAGSVTIKMLVIPAALVVSTFAPWVIAPLLAYGGLHLACEGMHHMRGKEDGHDHGGHGAHAPKTQKEFEKERIKQVLTIDGMLSVEITVMTLGVIAGLPALAAAGVLAMTGVIRTTWMYGLIGSIISLPRAAGWLLRRKGEGALAKAAHKLGRGIEKAMPYIVKGFSVAGVVALLMIGGGLLLNGIPGGEHAISAAIGSISASGVVHGLLTRVLGIGAGLVAGFAGRPLVDALEGGVQKGFIAVKNKIVGLFRRKPAVKKDQASPVSAPAAGQPAADALKNVPDVKSALNEAAVPVVKKDVPPAPDAPKPPSL